MSLRRRNIGLVVVLASMAAALYVGYIVMIIAR